MFPDIFNSDAFSLKTLTALINSQDHVPSRAGELAFAGVADGVATTSVAFEQINNALSLVQTSQRGAPAPQEVQNKSRLSYLTIPHVQLEETILASQVQNVREVGSMDQLRSIQSVIGKQMIKMNQRHDLTIEHLRLSALTGLVKDADGSTLADLFGVFGITPTADFDFDDVFNASANPTAETLRTVRTLCQQLTRAMIRRAKIALPGSYQIWALCGDEFFDKLIECTSVKGVWDGWYGAEQRMGGNYVNGVYRFADIMFENYRGTDDNSTVAIPVNQAQFFLTGVPGLYAEYYAPAVFMEAVNTAGLPYYAKIAPSDNMNRGVMVHTETNPLPICLRPATLIKGTSTGTTEA